jgi:hypothetical protein
MNGCDSGSVNDLNDCGTMTVETTAAGEEDKPIEAALDDEDVSTAVHASENGMHGSDDIESPPRYTSTNADDAEDGIPDTAASTLAGTTIDAIDGPPHPQNEGDGDDGGHDLFSIAATSTSIPSSPVESSTSLQAPAELLPTVENDDDQLPLADPPLSTPDSSSSAVEPMNRVDDASDL